MYFMLLIQLYQWFSSC